MEHSFWLWLERGGIVLELVGGVLLAAELLGQERLASMEGLLRKELQLRSVGIALHLIANYVAEKIAQTRLFLLLFLILSLSFAAITYVIITKFVVEYIVPTPYLGRIYEFFYATWFMAPLVFLDVLSRVMAWLFIIVLAPFAFFYLAFFIILYLPARLSLWTKENMRLERSYVLVMGAFFVVLGLALQFAGTF